MAELRQTVQLSSSLPLDACVSNLRTAVIKGGMWRSIRPGRPGRSLIGDVAGPIARIRFRWFRGVMATASAKVVLTATPNGTSAALTTEPSISWWLGLLVGSVLAIAGTVEFISTGATFPIVIAPAVIGLAVCAGGYGWFFVERRELVETIHSTLAPPELAQQD